MDDKVLKLGLKAWLRKFKITNLDKVHKALKKDKYTPDEIADFEEDDWRYTHLKK